ncbi:MAG: ROK family protein [Trueperaceae bacterium]
MDIGGTNTRARLADLNGTALVEVQEPTTAGSSDEIISQITRLRDRLFEQHGRARNRLRAVVMGTPGVVDPKTHRVCYAPNLPALEQPHFLDRLSKFWPVPIRMANDVNLAALGEARFEHKNVIRDFVFVSIGTGLGFGLVRDGIVYEGSGGRAGELGYLPYPPGCSTTIETFVSGPGISSIHRNLGGSGQAQDAFDEAHNQGTPGRETIERFLSDLAWLLAILSTLLDPHEIVLGGGVGVRCGPYLPRLNDALAQFSPIRPQLSTSKLGGLAGLVGAVYQALDDCRPMERLREEAK